MLDSLRVPAVLGEQFAQPALEVRSLRQVTRRRLQRLTGAPAPSP